MEKLIDSLVRAADAVAAYYQAAARREDAATEATRALMKRDCGAPCTTTGKMVGKEPQAMTLPKPPVLTSPAEKDPKEDKPQPPAPPVPAEIAKRKPGRPKGAVKTDAPAAPKEEPAGLPVDPEFAALSEEESTKRVYEVGEAMMDAYPKEEAGKNAPDGSPAPEGFFIAAEILKTRFGVEKLSKLNHAQRLQFMTILKGYLAKAQPQAAAPVEGNGETDPNLGV